MYLDDFAKKASTTIWEYEEPQKYLESRGFERQDVEHFGLGFVKVARIPKSSSQDYVAFCEATDNLRRLQGKILFPLRNILGNVHGFETRSLKEKLYVQYFLPEAKKAGAMFGLIEALPHIIRTKRVFVHEGAFNAMAFARIFPNTVSSLTSFLSAPQYELLMFFADKIILIYDRDKAGEIGVRKMAAAYGAKHLDNIFLGDDDANKYLQMFGREKFEGFIRSKIPKVLQE